MALIMTTVIILGVSGQNVFAAQEKTADRLYQSVVSLQENLIEEVAGYKVLFQNSLMKNKYLKHVLARNESNKNDVVQNEIVFVVEQISPKKIADKVVEQDRSPRSTATVAITEASRGGTDFMQEDLDLLAKIIYAEARGESFEGQVAVGAVVLNRVEHPQFPKTIKEVIYAPGQFTAVDDRQIELKPDSQAYQAAEAALEGLDPSNGAIFYFNPSISNDKWMQSRSVVCSIGNHRFCV